MSLYRHTRNNEVFIRADFDKVYAACEKAGNAVGNVKQSNKLLGNLVVKTPMKMFPPMNPTTLQISVMPQNEGCMVCVKSDSFDGTVGLGSAGRIIEKFYAELNNCL